MTDSAIGAGKVMGKMRHPTGCHIAPIPCYEPVMCGNCRFYLEKMVMSVWLCPACAKQTSRQPEPFYHHGLCEECGTESVMLGSYQ